MDLEAVSLEIQAQLGTITGLRVPPWGAKQPQVPAALVALPTKVDFDETYGRGKDRYPDLPVVVLVGAAEERASRKKLAEFAAGSGAKSVKAVLEARTWTSCDSVRVTSVDFDDTATYVGEPFLAAIFHLDIIGRGA